MSGRLLLRALDQSSRRNQYLGGLLNVPRSQYPRAYPPFHIFSSICIERTTIIPTMTSKYESVPWLKEKTGSTPSDSSRASEESEELLDHTVLYHRRTFRERLDSKWLWLTHAFLLMISCSLFILSITNRPSTLQHVRQYSAWSPADTSIQYKKTKYNITTDGNRFVGSGPEVDRAWREISYDMGDQWISKSDIARLEMPETSLKVNNPETGEEGYRVGIEVFHHLHCINLLRRVTYKDYYEPLGGEFEDGPEALKGHTGTSW